MNTNLHLSKHDRVKVEFNDFVVTIFGSGEIEITGPNNALFRFNTTEMMREWQEQVAIKS